MKAVILLFYLFVSVVHATKVLFCCFIAEWQLTEALMLAR